MLHTQYGYEGEASFAGCVFCMPNGEWELCWQISQARGKLPCSHSAQTVLQIASNHLRIIKKKIMMLKALEKKQNQNSNSKNKTKNKPQNFPSKAKQFTQNKMFCKTCQIW